MHNEDERPGMSRRRFLGAATAAGVGIWAASGATEPPKRPNIILICTDQQHWEAWGGADPFFDTPNIDALAWEGCVFTHAYCPTPQCSPGRAALYTGLYPHRTGVIGNLGSIDHDGAPIPPLPMGQETLGSRLRDGGYHTAYFGKWHLGNEEHFADHFDDALLDGGPDAAMTDRSIEYLEGRTAHLDQPFALLINYLNPHDIYEFGYFHEPESIELPDMEIPTPESWSETFENKPVPQKQFMTDDQGAYIEDRRDEFWKKYRLVYREKCRLVDVEVGRVMQSVRRLGLDDSTVIVFTSDHGDMDTHNRLVFKGPFMYDHLLRVPLIVRMPGGMHASTCDTFVGLTDLLPTLCEAAGVPGNTPDGDSLWPHLTGQGSAPEREFMVGQYYNKQRWVNPIRTIRTKEFKYNRYIHHGEELYDLQRDPEELVNLSGNPEYAMIKAELAENLARWMEHHDDTDFYNQKATDLQGNPFH